MRIAAIDIGTNTVLLLIADTDGGTIYPIDDELLLPRLGRDVDRQRTIHVSAFDRIAWILNEYKNIALQSRADRIVAAATSAVREASNRDEFLSHLQATTGISVEVLSGKAEALWTYRGAISGLPNIGGSCVVIDIGGGSTEISFQHSDSQLKHYSVPLGCVRLTERYIRHDPPIEKEVSAVTDAIHQTLQTVPEQTLPRGTLIGVAGTVTTLACLEQGLKEFSVERVAGFRLRRERVEFWMRKLLSMTSKQIRALSNTTEGRADILTIGVLILHEIMRTFQFDSIVVSERGLRYGLVLREVNRAE